MTPFHTSLILKVTTTEIIILYLIDALLNLAHGHLKLLTNI